MCAKLPSTLAGLSKVFKVSTPTIHAWRHGEKLPSSKKMSEIANIAKCSYDWLVTGRGTFEITPSTKAMEIARRIDHVEEDVVEYITVILDAAEKRGPRFAPRSSILDKTP